MERETNEAKQVGDQSQTAQKGEKAEPEPSDAQTAQKGEKAEPEPSDAQTAQKGEQAEPAEQAEPEPSDAQTAQKGEKAEPKPSDTKKLIQFMENNYEQYVANVQSFDDFYHAIFELIEMFCVERGQLQYQIPEKQILLEAYKRHHKAQGELKREEFIKISKEVIRPSSFTIGKATRDLLLFLFGAPFCALAAKRILPGLGWLSDDVVIPLATSGSVAYLVKTKQL